MSWWVSDILTLPNGYVVLFSWCFWVVLSICLHELGHGFAAIWEGDRTPIEQGHITLNPLVHMGGMSLLLFAIVGIAFGLMPVDPYRFRHGRLGDAIVAAAGPAVNLLLALLTLTALGMIRAWVPAPSQSNFHDNFIQFLYWGGLLNLILMVFNLLPVPPLDGSRILAGISRAADELYSKPEFQRMSLFILLALMWFGGGYLFPWAMNTSDAYVDLVVRILT